MLFLIDIIIVSRVLAKIILKIFTDYVNYHPLPIKQNNVFEQPKHFSRKVFSLTRSVKIIYDVRAKK